MSDGHEDGTDFEKLGDAYEIEKLAVGAMRIGAKKVMLEQAALLRVQAAGKPSKGGQGQGQLPGGGTEDEKRDKEKKEKEERQRREKEKKEMERKKRDGQDKTGEILAVLRGEHGAALCNLGKSPCDGESSVPSPGALFCALFSFRAFSQMCVEIPWELSDWGASTAALMDKATEGTLKGKYKELIYGFEIEFDQQGKISKWAGGNRPTEPKFGAQSAYVLVKQT